MSQLQFQCPASPMPAASAPMQLGQPQPGYSIPCASGTLPSESASQPIRNSALPAGSATPYSTTTGLSFLLPFDYFLTMLCFVEPLTFVFAHVTFFHKGLQNCIVCVFVKVTLCCSNPSHILYCLCRALCMSQ